MCANTSASKTLPGAETKAPKYSAGKERRRGGCLSGARAKKKVLRFPGLCALVLLDYRMGGAYCRPPCFQSAFWPRWIFSGEP